MIAADLLSIRQWEKLWWMDNHDCVCLQKKILEKAWKYDMTTENHPLCYHGVKRYIIFVFVFYLKLNKNKYRVRFIVTKDCMFNINQTYWKTQNSEVFHECYLFAILGNFCDLMEHFHVKRLLGRLIASTFLFPSHKCLNKSFHINQFRSEFL